MKGERGEGGRGGGEEERRLLGWGVWWKVKKNVLVSISKGVLKYNEQWRHHKNFFKVQEMVPLKVTRDASHETQSNTLSNLRQLHD